VSRTLGAAAGSSLLIRATPATPADAPNPPLKTETVAAAPASFRSQDVRVQGEVADWPTRIKHRDRGTFVMQETEGARLLVVPADGERLRAFKVGTAIVVHGRVVIPPDSRRLARRPTSRTAVAERAGAPALIKATRVDYEG
jgi:hypothetical protein